MPQGLWSRVRDKVKPKLQNPSVTPLLCRDLQGECVCEEINNLAPVRMPCNSQK